MDISSAAHHHYNHHLHHHQEMGGCQSESQPQQQQQQQVEKKARPAETEAQKCPRCDSINTKFCYYNNYSLTQPRYFCKNCRRYWTKGGTLRNVPVGGGCRKNNKRSSSPSSASPASFSSSSFLKRPHNSTQHQHIMSSSPTPINLFSAGLHLPYAGFNAYDMVESEGISNILAQPQSNNGGFLNSLGINLQNPACNYDHQLGMREEMGYESVKQEMSNEGRAFMGFPWPMSGDYGSISLGVGDLEPYRESWSGGQVGNLGLQGLINSAALI